MKTRFFGYTFLIFALSASCLAQRSGGSKPTLGSPGSTGSTTFPSSAPAPTNSAIFVSGKVVLDDGTELTEPAVIQTICQGRRHSETYSDSHGSFSFRFGDPSQGTAASISDASSSNIAVRSSTQSGRVLRDCQLQAELAGFSSQAVELDGRGSLMNSIDVGRVPLHRLAHVDGTSISVTSALAP